MKAEWNPAQIERLKCMQKVKNVKNLSDNDVLCLVEAICNILSGTVKLSKINKTALKPHVRELREISRIRSIPLAKRALIQTGSGFIAPLIPIIISLASSLISHVVQ